jgi:uncharacterized protein YjbJ (UPF0337 family)
LSTPVRAKQRLFVRARWRIARRPSAASANVTEVVLPGGTFRDIRAYQARWHYVGETTMDWNRIEGNWKQAKGSIKEKWGQLTDDDLDQINGRRDQLEGKIQERYGIAKDMARKNLDDWLSRQP